MRQTSTQKIRGVASTRRPKNIPKPEKIEFQMIGRSKMETKPAVNCESEHGQELFESNLPRKYLELEAESPFEGTLDDDAD